MSPRSQSQCLLLFFIGAATVMGAAPVAKAQTPATSGIELSVHAGGSRVGALEGGHLGFLVGARAMLVERNRLRFGGTFNVLPGERWTGYLFSLGVERVFLASKPVRPFLGIGIGGMGVNADTDLEHDIPRIPRMSLLLPLVVGIDWPGPEGAHWRVRTEVRNDIIVRDDVPCNCANGENEGGADSGWGFSVGVSWRFGD